MAEPLFKIVPRWVLSPFSIRRRSASSRALRSMIVAVIVFAGVTLWLSDRFNRAYSLRDPVFDHKFQSLKRALRGTTDDRPILFFGSSRVDNGFRGIDAEADYRQATSRQTVVMNCGFAGAGPFLIDCYANRIESNGIRPRAICLEIMPTFIHQKKTGPFEAYWFSSERFTLRERTHFYQLSGLTPDTPVPTSENPWEKGKSAILMQSAPWMLSRAYTMANEQNFDDHGWHRHVFESTTAADREKWFANAARDFGPTLKELDLTGSAPQVLRKFIDEHREIPIRIVLMPESTEYRKLYGPGANDRLMAYIASLNVPFTDARDWVPDEQFADGHHLIHTGAKEFTTRFTRDVLVPWLAGQP